MDIDWKAVVQNLDINTRVWIESLDVADLSAVLKTCSKLPNMFQAVKYADSSAAIGKQGEKTFEQVCKNLPSNYKVVNTTKSGKQGDFIISYKANNKIYNCLVDVKNYKSTIPKKEVDKFYLDIESGNYDAGLIISLGSKFVGIESAINIESHVFTYAELPCMFLSQIDINLIPNCIELLFLRISSLEEKNASYCQITNTINYINSAVGTSVMTRRLLEELTTQIHGTIHKCQENLLSMEIKIKQSIDLLKSEDSKELPDDNSPDDNSPDDNSPDDNSPEQELKINYEYPLISLADFQDKAILNEFGLYSSRGGIVRTCYSDFKSMGCKVYSYYDHKIFVIKGHHFILDIHGKTNATIYIYWLTKPPNEFVLDMTKIYFGKKIPGCRLFAKQRKLLS